ncbi:MAG: protein BatD [Bacteroidetes bacterium]|nr:protein BatD [Bacteroidota bacterium]
MFSFTNTFAQGFRATADRSEIAMDRAVHVTYTFENVEVDDFNPPNFGPFEVFGPSQSRNMSWVNGKVTQTLTYTYTLKPTREGDFEIPAANARLDGEVKKSNAVSIKVVAAGTSTPNNNQSNNRAQSKDLEQQIRDNLFVRAIPSKTTSFEGEQITLTYKLYFGLTLDDLSILKMPSYEGFLSHDIELPEGESARKVETFNGQQYNTQSIHQVALFPSKNGSYSIDPMELQSYILIRKNDPGFFFPRTERIKHDFKSPGVKIEVKPLPASGRPSTFTGAVGKYDFSAEYDKTSTMVDDPITLKIKVSGKGNIKLIDVPDLDFPQSFEIYDPKIKESISKKSYTVSGSKTYEYLIIPRGGGTFQFPDINFSYFDVGQGTYVTKTEAGPLITVEGDAISPQNYPSGGLNKEEVELLGEDIRFIKTGSLKTTAASGNLITRPLFQILTWLPLFLAMFLPFIYHRRKKILADTTGLKSKKAHKEASNRLSSARKLMSDGDDRSFYDAVSKSIWGYLADKFNVPNTELSKQNIIQLLSDRGIEDSLRDETLGLIDNCEMAVYAPMAVSESKASMVEKATDLISRLEKEIERK